MKTKLWLIRSFEISVNSLVKGSQFCLLLHEYFILIGCQVFISYFSCWILINLYAEIQCPGLFRSWFVFIRCKHEQCSMNININMKIKISWNNNIVMMVVYFLLLRLRLTCSQNHSAYLAI